MNLGEALMTSLTASVVLPDRNPKSPISSTRGRQARMRALEKEHGSGPKAARAAGISPTTWRAWNKAGAKPRPETLQRLQDALAPLHQRQNRAAMAKALQGGATPRVCAIVKWGRSRRNYTVKNDGQRCTNLDQLYNVDLSDLARPWSEGDRAGLADTFERIVSDTYDEDGIQFEGDAVTIEW